MRLPDLEARPERPRRSTGFSARLLAARLFGVLPVLVLLSGPGMGQDYRYGSLAQKPPSSLPGRARGVLLQTEHGGPLRFSRDGFVVPNVYVIAPSDKTPHDFQVNGRGDKLHLSTGFRSMVPTDVDPSSPAYSLVDIEVNQGKGVQGLNGILVGRCHPLALKLTRRVAQLERDVDRVARGYQAQIRPYFDHAKKAPDPGHPKAGGGSEGPLEGRRGENEAGKFHEIRAVEATWLSDANAVQLRFARSLAGRGSIAPTGHRHGPRWQMWEVPYLTVCYRLAPDGHVITRVVVPPGDPVATARKYNPGGSPW